MLINDCAICVRAIDYSETSQVVTFFARQAGKVTLMAKGSKRTRLSFGGPIELFSCGKMVYSDSGRDKMGTLAEFEQLPEMPNSSALAGDMFTLNCCLFAVELVNLLTTDFDPHPGLFDALVTFLHDAGSHKTDFISVSSVSLRRDSAKGFVSSAQRSGVPPFGGGVAKNSAAKTLVHLVLFQLRLLKEIGLCPVFEFCVNCKNHFNTQSQQVYFSNNARGLICKDCQGAFPDCVQIAKKAVGCLTNVDSIASADERTVEEIEGILISYFTDTLGRTPKMAKYVTRR